MKFYALYDDLEMNLAWLFFLFGRRFMLCDVVVSTKFFIIVDCMMMMIFSSFFLDCLLIAGRDGPMRCEGNVVQKTEKKMFGET